MVERPSGGPLTGGSCGRSPSRFWWARAPMPARRPRAWARKALWSALFAAVLAAGLWLGAARPSPSTTAARVYAIASQLRCPVCIDESAAQANTAPARAIRADIAARLRQGENERQIIAYMVSRYGRWILLSTPTSGLGLTVWAAPVVVAMGALAVVGSAWAGAVRRSRETRTVTGVEAEGELFEPHAALQPADVGRTGEVPTPGRKSTGNTARPRQPLAASWRRLSLPAGVALVVLAVALLLLDHFTSPEVPGGTITGSAPGLATELEEAEALTAKDPARPLALYQQVLKTYPDEPVALTGEGWIYAEAGFGSLALAELAKAERADPSYSVAHLYRGLVLLEEDKQPQAAAELNWFLAHDPSPNLVQAARRALAEAQR